MHSDSALRSSALLYVPAGHGYWSAYIVPLSIEIVRWSEVTPFVSPVYVFTTVSVPVGSPGQYRPLGHYLNDVVDVPSQ